MKNLRICFTTDTHGNLFPTNYHVSNRNDMEMGLLKIIPQFNKDNNTLIIDGGDTIQGSPLTLYASRQANIQNPMAEALNLGQYDFVALGNHDLNYGIDYLSKYINELNTQCLCANIRDKHNKLNVLPYAIKKMENGIKVGIVGICTHHILRWEKPSTLKELHISEVIQPAKEALAIIKNQVDISMCLYHGGFERDVFTGEILSESDENQAYKIASELDFDLLLTGHQHMDIEGVKINNCYCVQTNANAQNFCEINIEFKNGKISNIKSELKKPNKDIHKNIPKSLIDIQTAVEKWLDIPIGKLSCPLNAKRPLDMAKNGSLIANFINQVQIKLAKSQISACSLANEIKGLNQEVSVRDVVSTYIYSNTFLVLKISGATLKQYMERTAEYFQLKNGSIEVSHDFIKPKIAHYNYDYFYGLEYAFDIRQPIGNRVVKMEINGKNIEMDEKLSIIINNYRASGTGGYDMLCGQEILKDIQEEASSIIIEALEKHKIFHVDESIHYKIIY